MVRSELQVNAVDWFGRRGEERVTDYILGVAFLLGDPTSRKNTYGVELRRRYTEPIISIHRHRILVWFL